MSVARSARLRLLLLAALAVAGCYKPNGKTNTLYFGLQFPGGAGNGLAQDLLIPETKEVGHFHADFSNMTLAGDGRGLTVLQNEHLASGAFRLRVGCDATVDSVTRELRVAISDPSGVVRYEDRYDLNCLRSQSVSYGPPFALALGGRVELPALITALDAQGKTVAAFGYGFEVVGGGASLAVNDEEVGPGGMLLIAEGVHPGPCPRLRAGAVDQVVGCEVLDDAAWQLGVAVTSSAANVDGGARLRLDGSVKATGLDGGAVLGLHDCDFTVSSGGQVLATALSCSPTFELEAGAAGEACATALGHSACTPF